MQPANLVYHRGQFVPYAQATLEVQDRGVLFADGVYEVVRYDRGRAFAMTPHVERLGRSLAGIELLGVGLPGVDPAEVAARSDELVERNKLRDAKVYWQVTRGPQPRDFLMPPPEELQPSVTLIAYPASPIERDAPLAHGSAIIADDIRWTRCWIKSLMLLPASLAKTRAKKIGAVEALFERAKPGQVEKHLTEGSSTNLFMVRDGRLQTHPLDGWVLPGITRATLLSLATDLGIHTLEQPFTRDELITAEEVFVCSTTQLTALTAVDGSAIAGPGDGRPGPITTRLHHAYLDAILS